MVIRCGQRLRQCALLATCAVVLSACGSHAAPAGPGAAPGGCAPRPRPAGAADARSRRTAVGDTFGGRAGAGGGRAAQASVYRRLGRQGRTDVVRDRPGAAARRTRCGAGGARAGGGPGHQCAYRRAAHARPAAERTRIALGSGQCRGHRALHRGGHAAGARGSRHRAHQFGLCDRHGPHRRTRRTAGRDGRGAGRARHRDLAHHRGTDRSHLRELRSTRDRHPAPAPRTVRRQRHGGGHQPGDRAAVARGRHPLRAQRYARL